MHRKPRIELSESELKAALETCAKEPIHIPGSIQPHGFLIVFCSMSHIIEHVSENIDAFLGQAPDAILGKTVEDVFGAGSATTILMATTKSPLEPLESSVIKIGGQSFDAVANRWNDKTILEFEPQPSNTDYSSDKFYYDQVRHLAVGLREAKNAEDLHDLVVNEIFRLTKIDRVKLYKFDEEWNGEVVAEARASHMPSYLGLHFPSTDIPEQARKLYTKSYLRIIPDISYRPSPIIPGKDSQTGEAVDLSQSVLRSVSPVHIQYLDNMDVRASLSISVIQNGRLWGLIACHHNAPLYIPYRIRMVAEVIGHIFSAQLSSFHEIERTSDEQKKTLLLEKLSSAIRQTPSLGSLFSSIAPLALEAMKASGLVLFSNNEHFSFGETPDEDTLAGLFAWLKKRDITDVVYTDHAHALLGGESGLDCIQGGFMASRVTVSGNDYAIWFRSSIAREVKWAGNPEKTAEATKAGYRLSPRSSFSLWKEHTKSRSTPWTEDDITTALSVVKIFVESKQVIADQANIAKSEFMANLSHELRTPMNAILGLTNILVGSQPLSEKQRMYLNTLRGSADNLLSLINDLLDIAKIESRNVELESISFNLPRLVQEIISMMSVRAIEKGLKLELQANALETPFYEGDPTRLRQILVNLVGNALKFTNEGSIRINIESDSIDQRTRRVRFDVVDTGIGIAKDKLESIFEKFTQADASINRRFGGTGLGLSITKTLVELMGGRISVKSDYGDGSTFSFWIPLKTAEGHVNAATEPGSSTPQDIEPISDVPKVLIVEDFEANALVAGAFLDEFGYGYDHARDGLEAVDMVGKNDYFAILMDVQMHNMNGFEATKAIRALEQENGNVHYIIGMTAHALSGDRERCYAAGMDDYMSKPFNPKELKSKLLTAVFSRQQISDKH